MRFVCLGFREEPGWVAGSEKEPIIAYDNELRRGGHLVNREILQPPPNAATLKYQNGHAVISDGPHGNPEEQLGFVLILEARDLNHAIQLMALHPCARAGPVEIRPAVEEGRPAV
jgi:hypothetical protein